MPRCLKMLVVLVVLASLPCRAEEISPAGRRLAQKLDAMDVEHLWLPGQAVAWKTGEPLATQPGKGHHTHCSAFAAEACRRLGIYLLRPPEHSTVLLANAQYDWLFTSGKEYVWMQLSDGRQAQHYANEGRVVLAVFKESGTNHPGHVAIVRPSTKSSEAIDAEGPQVTQAGSHNARSTSLKAGFAKHPNAWGRQQVRYFAHKVETDKAQFTVRSTGKEAR